METSKLHIAIMKGDILLVNDLLWDGYDPNETCWESSMNTPLLLAASLANVEIIRMLCNHGCDMNTRTIHGETALHLIIASKKNLDEGIKMLLDYGCDANIQENLYGQTPLHSLVKHLIATCDYSESSMNTLKYLVEKSNTSIGDHSNRTALHRAAYAKAHISCIQALLDCGPNNKNSRGENALHEALEADNGIDVLSLLANHTDLKQITIYGENPLHIAARKGRSDVVKYLIDFGAPVNAQDLKGNTPLHLGAERGYKKVVEEICKYPNINLNIQNSDGLTALHVAVESGFLSVVEVLLKADSCDVSMKTKKSQTALDIAQETFRRNSQPQISKLLFSEIRKRESDKVI